MRQTAGHADSTEQAESRKSIFGIGAHIQNKKSLQQQSWYNFRY
jgi:hypothetical protein